MWENMFSKENLEKINKSKKKKNQKKNQINK